MRNEYSYTSFALSHQNFTSDYYLFFLIFHPKIKLSNILDHENRLIMHGFSRLNNLFKKIIDWREQDISFILPLHEFVLGQKYLRQPYAMNVTPNGIRGF